MSEKIYNISSENGKSYKAIVKTGSNSLSLKLQNSQSPGETYEVSNLSLDDLHNLHRIYKQFDSVSKVAEVMGKKLEKNNIILKTDQCVLKFKHTNEYDDDEYIAYVLPSTGTGSSGPSVGGSSYNSGELDRLRRENEDLKRQLRELKGNNSSSTSTYSAPSSSYQPSYQPKVTPPSYNPQKPKPKPVEKKPEPKKEPEVYYPNSMISHPGMGIGKPNITEIKDKRIYNEKEQIYNLDRRINYKSQGDIWSRMNICKDRINNVKGTLDDIQRRFDPLQKTYDNIVAKTFAKDCTQAEKDRVMDLIWQILLLYLEYRELIHYEEMFRLEIEESGRTLSPSEEEKFKANCVVFNKRLPFDQGQRYQKMSNVFRDILKRFFIDKNLRHYKPEEKENICHFYEVLTWTSN